MKRVGGKKHFSMQKNDNLSFFSLGSQPVEMDLLAALSPSVSRKVFYSVSRFQWGHAAATTLWPVPLTVSIPIRFLLFLSSPLHL